MTQLVSKSDEEKTNIGPSAVLYQSGSRRDVRYLHLNRLGSVEAVTTSRAAEYPDDARSFDAFGKPRVRDWQSQDKLHMVSDFNKTTERGFTGHEHLDDIYLIHMNGRVYDYRLGRFLSVDPIISNPANSQSINPYSYIGNNPLSGVDPTGYKPKEVVGGPSSGGAEFSKCDVTIYNTPNSANIAIVEKSGAVSFPGIVSLTTPADQLGIARAVSAPRYTDGRRRRCRREQQG